MASVFCGGSESRTNGGFTFGQDPRDPVVLESRVLQEFVLTLAESLPRNAEVQCSSRPPVEVILERLRTRTTNEFGKSPLQRERILRDIVETEPLLRSAATHEIDTSQPLPKIVDSLIRIAHD
ncbi:MAG: hypothetical protein JWR37_2138 [Mycobacterium sp.]|nr:hypothetical protein [Mycobacterium sp.]